MSKDVGDQARRRMMDRIGAVQGVLRRWDPAGLEPGVLAPLDEYDSYAATIASLVEGGCSAEALADHLQSLRSEWFREAPNPAHDRRVAEEIIAALRDVPR